MTERAGSRSERGQAGFSLVEIMVALLFLVIIVTVVSRTSSNARKVQHGAYFSEQASAFAQGKIDLLAAAPFPAVAAGKDTVTIPLGPAFYRSWTVVNKGATKEVEVTVTWKAAGQSHDVKLATRVQ